jgi:hypothetical protein
MRFATAMVREAGLSAEEEKAVLEGNARTFLKG